MMDKSKKTSFLISLFPKPGQGFIGLDIIYILVIVALQTSLIPSVFTFSSIDLLTPWLAYNFIALSSTQGMFLGLVGGLALEQHGSSPTGMYICTYWIMGVLILMVRQHISWRNVMPWVTTFVLSQFWLILFETFVFLIKTSGLSFISLSFGFGILIRLFTAFSLGLYFSRKSIGFTGEERTV